MTDKQAVLDAVQRLPDNVTLAEIADELEIMAAVHRGRKDIAEGRFKTQDEVRSMFRSWATEWKAK